MNLDDFLGELRKEIEAGASTRYEVPPQMAYAEAGYPHGPFRWGGSQKCIGCGLPVKAYSQAGAREVSMSGECEPCFDFVCIAEGDRSPVEQSWMKLVKYKED